MRSVFSISLAAFAVLVFSSLASADTYYVSAASSPTGDGTSGSPFSTIAEAISVAGNGDTIAIGQGTYAEYNLSPASGVTILGGYPGHGQANAWDDAYRYPQTYSTILEHDGTKLHVSNNTLVDGLTFDSNWQYQYSLNSNGFNNTFRNLAFREARYGLQVNGVTTTVEKSPLYNATNGVIYVAGDAQAVVRNSEVRDEITTYGRLEAYGNEFNIDTGYGLQFRNGNAHVHDNTFNADGGDAIEIDGDKDGGILIENNEFHVDQNDKAIHVDEDGGNALIRKNKFYLKESALAVDGDNDGEGERIAFVQNLVKGTEPGGSSDYALIPSDDHSYYIVEDNNFTGLYRVFDTDADLDDDQAEFHFRNNLGWLNGYSQLDQYPFQTWTVTDNCTDGGLGAELLLETQSSGSDPYRYFPTFADAEYGMNDLRGNMTLDLPPSDEMGTACGGKGAGGTAKFIKPVAIGRVAPQNQFDEERLTTSAINRGGTVELIGEHSAFFGPGEFEYKWKQLSGPETLALWDESAGNVTAVPTVSGKYTFELVVEQKDDWVGTLTSDPVVVTLWVNAKVSVLTSNGSVRGKYDTLQEAVDEAKPGDTVSLPAGWFFVDSDVEVSSKSGITIAGAGMNNTTIVTADDDGFDVDYSRDITFRDFAWVLIDGSRDEAIDLYQTAGIVITRIKVDGRLVYDNDPVAIRAHYSDVLIKDNEFSYLYDGLKLYDCGEYTIRGNKFKAIYDDSIYISGVEGYNDGCTVGRFQVVDNTFDMMWSSERVIYPKNSGTPGERSLIAGNRISNYSDEAIYAYYQEGILEIRDNIIWNEPGWENQGGNAIYLYYATADIVGNILWNAEEHMVQTSCCSSSETVYLENNVIVGSREDYGIYNEYTDGNEFLAWAKGNILWGNQEGPYYQVNVLDGNEFMDPGFADPDNGNFSLKKDSPLHGLGIGSVNTINVPPAPRGLHGEPLFEGAQLTFDMVKGATGYKVFWGDKLGSYDQSQDLGNELVATIDGLAETPYYFAVAALNKNGQGPLSQPVVIKPYAAKPSDVSNVSVDGVFPYKIRAGSVVELEITGADFRQGAKVWVGGTEIEVLEVTEMMIKAKTTPEVKYGIQPVIVVNADLGRGSLPQALIVSRGGGSSEGGCRSGGEAGLALMLGLLPLFAMRMRRRDS